MKKVVGIVLIICIQCLVFIQGGNGVLAQDIHFSQFYMSPLTQNPALAGAVFGMEANVNYKEQWRSVSAPYKTLAASYSMGFQKKKKAKGFFAAGVNFFNDKAGDSKMGTTQANISGAGHVYLNRYSKFGGGLQIGFAQRSIDYTSLTWGNQYDGKQYNPGLSNRENLPAGASKMYPDVAAGVVYTYDNNASFKRVADNNDFKVNVGMAIFHLSRPDYSFTSDVDKLYVKFVLHGNALLSIPYTNIGFVPGFFVYKQGAPAEVYAGSLVRYVLNQKSKYTRNKSTSAVAVGAYYRAKDAAVVSFLLEHSNYAFGVSYDLNVSRLKVATVAKGGVEISLRYTARNPFIVQSRSRF